MVAKMARPMPLPDDCRAGLAERILGKSFSLCGVSLAGFSSFGAGVSSAGATGGTAGITGSGAGSGICSLVAGAP